MTDVIEVTGLTVRYAGATALDGVDLRVGAGEMVALVGANGAGKSTLVKALSGLLRPAGGTVVVRGRLAQVPEGREMFGDLTVDDNLRLGGWRNGRHGRDTGPVYELFPELAVLRRRRAGSLSGGQQQMVAIGRALMSRPEVLLIDELSLGLAPMVVAMLVAHLRDLHASRGLAVLLIEQNARLALELCERAYVLESGRIAVHGRSADLARDPRVTAAYLGGHVAAP
ncbi:branched-chain amino acid transport system ATP-binding protein [Actinoplanes lutulentus]|uniref:Amino acid/amide ABC transporter ATP-binding protein 2 (HAAT family) n=1 Tax=Actinoplanes lutulentus TaxID=1287878 RepID=A0A327ZHI5_9ACTN|nr:ABC transporter ATP-binding protein [Actinoplanes lutulentus]MBB2944361.1 branched-chain amino acid transport system ATP-binding protein [Actinoplanes lutulentus]RAK42407.1 amino acid/amide ABC transporter ATP-binding protein 2 (HAAT family) [Actinoplanes lutulentus]